MPPSSRLALTDGIRSIEAARLGLDVPDKLLTLADQVIE
jgi:hypothetical protein